MKPAVIDASVAAKWFFPEDGSRAALRLLGPKRRLLAPDLLRSEFGNIVWKLLRRKLLSHEEAKEIVEQFLAMPIEIYGSDSLLPVAMEIAISTQRTVYDCMYVALALQQDAVCVTADARLVNVLQSGPYRRSIRLLGARR